LEGDTVVAEVTQAFAGDERIDSRGGHPRDAKVIGPRQRLFRQALQYSAPLAMSGVLNAVG
jgi:hypothetical protein